MSSVAVSKSRINGIVEAMPSKSYAHRIMICAALCNSPVTVSGITGSDDMLATMGCLKAMGAQFEPVGIDEYIITPIKQTKKAVLDCIESGSTLRFMLAVASAVGGEYTFTGKGRLAERPNDALLSVLSTHGVRVKGNGLPLEVCGHLLPGEYVVDGAVSSQFVSGLLLAAPLTGGKVTVTVEGGLKSRGYVDITVDVMKTFGVDVKVEGQSFTVEAGQKYLSPDRVSVEGDWSNAAFPLALGLLCGRVEVTGLNAQSLQGDMRAIDVMRLLGGNVKNEKGAFIARESRLFGAEFNVENIIDAAPVLSVLCAFASGESRICGVSRLRIKESDRLQAIIDIVQALGRSVRLEGDELIIGGSFSADKIKINGMNDHRIVMSGAVVGACVGDTVVTDIEAVNKSYPNFFEQFRNLGGVVDVI